MESKLNSNDITIVGSQENLIELAVVNKETGIVENLIVVNNIPNSEPETHAYVSTHKELDTIRKGWKYNFETYKFWTDDPSLRGKPEYTAEEMLKMEELAWEKMLEGVKEKMNSKQDAGGQQNQT